MHLLVTGKSGTLAHRAGGSETWVLEINEPGAVVWESDSPTPKKGRIGPAQFASLWQNGTVGSPAPVNATVKLNNDPNTEPLAVQLTTLTFNNNVLEITAEQSTQSTGGTLLDVAKLRPVVLQIDADMVACPIRFSQEPARQEGEQFRSLLATVTDQQSRVNAAIARTQNEYRAWVTKTEQSGTSYEQWRADGLVDGKTEAQLSKLEKGLKGSLTKLNNFLTQQNIAVQRYVGNGTWQTIKNPDGKPFLALQQTGCLK